MGSYVTVIDRYHFRETVLDRLKTMGARDLSDATLAVALPPDYLPRMFAEARAMREAGFIAIGDLEIDEVTA